MIASELGICVLQDNKAKVIKGDKLNSSFSKIKADDNGYVWACGERGLFIIKDSVVVYEYSIAGQEKVSAFEFNNEGFVWLSTMKGIHGMSVKYEDGKIDLKEEYLINENAGLISNDISSMYYDKTFNKLWAGTSEGLASIDLNSFNNQLDHTLPLRILNIRTLILFIISPETFHFLNM
ncbi:MAG: hypothetical protein R2942_00865 [Ignavibacteria bacterium]